MYLLVNTSSKPFAHTQATLVSWYIPINVNFKQDFTVKLWYTVFKLSFVFLWVCEFTTRILWSLSAKLLNHFTKKLDLHFIKKTWPLSDQCPQLTALSPPSLYCTPIRQWTLTIITSHWQPYPVTIYSTEMDTNKWYGGRVIETAVNINTRLEKHSHKTFHNSFSISWVPSVQYFGNFFLVTAMFCEAHSCEIPTGNATVFR